MEMTTLIWLGLMILFLVAEAATVTMVSIWFAAGSLAALLVSLLHPPLWVQVVVFILVSGVALAALRPMAKKHFNPRLTRTNVDAVVGAKGYVTAHIDNLTSSGQVKLNGMEWTARSAYGQEIPVGTLVKVERIEGVKAFVSPVEVKAEV